MVGQQLVMVVDIKGMVVKVVQMVVVIKEGIAIIVSKDLKAVNTFLLLKYNLYQKMN